MTMPGSSDDWRPWAAERWHELMRALAFLTLIPFRQAAPAAPAPAEEAEGAEDAEAAAAAAPDLGHAAWAFPLAGVVVGIIGAIVYAVVHRLGLGPWPAAAVALAATLLVTGALHEDGLADSVDGFGGGATAADKLAIMRDSRIGAFGVCALILSILIRSAALASLSDAGPVAAALIAAHAGGRAAMAPAMFFVPAARSDGLSAAAGRPQAAQAIAAAVIALVVAFICLGPGRAIEAAVVVAAATALIAWFARREIGGQTGDVLGAIEQVGETAVLLVAAG